MALTTETGGRRGFTEGRDANLQPSSEFEPPMVVFLVDSSDRLPSAPAATRSIS